MSHIANSLPSVSPTPGKTSSVSVSTLKSGLTVVTEDSCNTSTVTMTYPKAGSAGELLEEQGAALMNKCMNFKSGSGMSTLLINRTIEDEGGMMFTDLTREAATLGYTVSRESAVELVPLLATNCSFEKWDVRDAGQLLETQAALSSESVQVVLSEILFAAAYGPQSAAGRPLYSVGCPIDATMAFRNRNYGLNGAVLAATGIEDHGAFCAETEGLLESAPMGNPNSCPTPIYVGGESRVSAPYSGYAHVALAFPAPASGALTSVLKHTFCVAGSAVSVSGFSTTGLVGVYSGSSAPETLVNDMITVVKATVSSDVVSRAKALAKGEALLALEDGSKSLAAAMTSSVLTGAHFASPADVAKMFDSVTEAQVKSAITEMIKTNPSLAAVGDISNVPYHASIGASLA